MSSNNANRRAKMEKEREKQVQDRLQVLICEMLKDEDNKYCVDCDSKGPRWCSWNLGLFLCIRCAGIHRNLGVHISKVKSVNLDSWTPQQVASLQMMGNSRARAVYEANLPDGFLRPQNNQALEQFIRAKYEKKKYIAKEYVPEKPPEFPEGWYELIEAEKQKKDIRKIVLPSHNASTKPAVATSTAPSAKPKSPTSAANNNQSAAAISSSSSSSPSKDNKSGQNATAAKPKSSDDLFGLAVGHGGGGGDADLLGISGSSAANSASNDFAAFVSAAPSASSTSAATSATTATTGNADEKDFFNQTAASAAEDKAKSTKDSIMALFGKQQQNGFGQPQQQMFGSNFQMNQPQNTGSAVPPNQFGVNPQSNPFLNSGVTAAPVASTTAASGGLDLFGAAASGGNQSNFSQMQNQFGGLNFGGGGLNAFGAPQTGGAAAPVMPPVLSQPPQQPAATSSAANDILGLF